MAMPSAPPRYWTPADLEGMPDDGQRYEVLDGELLVTPQPSYDHQHAVARLQAVLVAYCVRWRIGNAVGPGTVPVGDSRLEPDIQVVPGPRPPYGTAWAELPRPILIVEALSPSMEARDRGIKRAAYLRWGIPEYWIVDIDAKVVAVVRPNQPDRTVTDILHWQPSVGIPALEIAVEQLFR